MAGSPSDGVRAVRVAVSPYLFRGMLLSMAVVAVALHRATGSRDLAWRFAKARARTLAWMLGVDVQVHGREHLASGGPFVFTPNHQSHLDILVLLGMVPIDREHPERAIEALRREAQRDHSLVIFPEGTRSRDGRLGEFKKGAFVTAIELGLPVVPVVCRGTRRLMPRGSRLAVAPGKVEIVIEAPIPTTGLSYADRVALAARAREAVLRHHTGW